MARQVSSRSAGSSTTTTITLENPAPPQRPQQETLVLRLTRPPLKKKVSWKEGTVDNEFLQRKSSKKCCIFHKQKPFDEDDSDDEEDCGEHSHRADKSEKHLHGEDGGCYSKDGEVGCDSTVE
ncbi:hypothetical protein ACHQM5_027685 [Ranunculus cassubicifolius]